MKTINYLKSTMKELRRSPIQYDREIAEILECISELEEAMKPKTCEGCIYAQVRYYSHVTVWF